MADRIAYKTYKFDPEQGEETLQNIPVMLYDMGDGTFAEKMLVTATGESRPGGLTDASGTCTGASVEALPANATRRFLLVQNPSKGNKSFWIDFAHPAAVQNSPSIEVAPGIALAWDAGFVPDQAMQVIGDAGVPYTVQEG